MIKIRNHYTNEILHTVEAESLKEAVVKLVGEKVSLGGANLRNAYLGGADLHDANLRDADLRGANLWNANLRNAYLGGADLHDANLWNADLRDANLLDANLWNADLRGAYLLGADLRDANVSTFCFEKHIAIYTSCGTVTIGCERHKLDHWLDSYEKIGVKHGYNEKQIKVYRAWLELCSEVLSK